MHSAEIRRHIDAARVSRCRFDVSLLFYAEAEVDVVERMFRDHGAKWRAGTTLANKLISRASCFDHDCEAIVNCLGYL